MAENLLLFPRAQLSVRIKPKKPAHFSFACCVFFFNSSSFLVYSLGGLQRRKDIYGDDALEFRPERWEGRNVNRWHFIPYNQ